MEKSNAEGGTDAKGDALPASWHVTKFWQDTAAIGQEPAAADCAQAGQAKSGSDVTFRPAGMSTSKT